MRGVTHPIRTHFRDILRVLQAFDDPELEDGEKVYICLYIVYRDFDALDPDDYEDAFKAAVEFIEGNVRGNNKLPVRLMDWVQDEPLLFPAINKVAGFETRSAKYLHWWTFLGCYMEISDGVFAQILAMRSKLAKHKPLEKWEREYWSANKDICVLKPKLSAEEQEKKDRLNALLG